MGKNHYFTFKEIKKLELDVYLAETIKEIEKNYKKQIDLFNLNSDLKQYILDESETLCQNENITINEAVEKVLQSIGTPKQFADKILKEIKHEKLYLLGKILVAVVIAGFPIVILLAAFIR